MAPVKSAAPVKGMGLMTSFFTKSAPSSVTPSSVSTPSHAAQSASAKKELFSSGSTDMDVESPALVLKQEKESHDSVSRLISSKHAPSPIVVTQQDPVKPVTIMSATADDSDESVVPAKKRKLVVTGKRGSSSKPTPVLKKNKRVIASDDEAELQDSVSEKSGDDASAFEESSSGEEGTDDDDSEGGSMDASDDESVASGAPHSKKTTAARKSAAKKAAPVAKKAAAPAKMKVVPVSGGSVGQMNSRMDNFSAGANVASATSFFDETPTENSNLVTQPSKPMPILPEGVFGTGTHDHDTLDFLTPKNRRDKDKKAMNDPDYNQRTLLVPQKFLTEQTPAMQQWWEIKSANMDTVLFFKVGKFYELFHMDADIGMKELDLIYMKGSKAHSGFPEVSYGKFASQLVTKGYRVARVEQTETPEMLSDRNMKKGGKKDKVVAREMCSIMSKGTRTYCHLDDLSMLDNTSASTSVLICVKESKAAAQVDATDTDVSEADKVCMPEYGICVVDTVIGTVTLGQFSDDLQRTRLRTMLSRYMPTEIVLERHNFAAETSGAIQLLAGNAAKEFLRPSELPSPSETLTLLKKGVYYGSSADAEYKTWPVVLQAVIQGMQNDSSSLAMAALGGALFQLKRSLIDYEVLSLGRVFGYVPPDDESNKVSQLIETSSSAVDTSSLVNVGSGSSASAGHGGETDHMTLDAVSLSNLEILYNNFDRTEKGSLWSFVDRCKTSFGKRLLKEWLCHPLFRAEDIKKRADAVEELLTDCVDQSKECRDALNGIPDLERLLARVHTNGLKKKGIDHPDSRAIMYESPIYTARKIKDLSDILSGFEKVLAIRKIFNSDVKVNSLLLRRAVCEPAPPATDGAAPKRGMSGKFPAREVAKLLTHFRDIFDEKQAKKDGNIKPKPGVNRAYDEAKERISSIVKDFDNYLVEQKKLLGVNTLVYWGTNKDRYQIEVAIKDASRVPSSWTSKSQKKTHRRYWTADIEKRLASLVKAEQDLEEAQQDTLRQIFEKFDGNIAIWRDALACVSILDALLSLSLVSSSPNYCWPDIRDRSKVVTDTAVDPPLLHIIAGRHPMVEATFTKNNDGDYIPNSVSLGGKIMKDGDVVYQPKMLLLSGPNMGGKSTLLRQTCLIAIMAQLGMKVPAESVRMTPVDRIFTRVGASDRILAGQSTFFVELAETAIILKQSTQDSLCILDELGRGTATFDGTAIAHAVVDHLVRQARCRSLFATHYHSLVDDWAIDPRVILGHMQCIVIGQDGNNNGKPAAAGEEVAFLYNLAEGSSPRSYGINVARLAMLPAEVIELACQQSKEFEEKLSKSENSKGSGDVGMSATTRGVLYSFFDRLVSIAKSNLSFPELVGVAKEMYQRYKSIS